MVEDGGDASKLKVMKELKTYFSEMKDYHMADELKNKLRCILERHQSFD